MLKKNKPLILVTLLIFTFAFLAPAFLVPATAAAAAPAVTTLAATYVDDESAALNGQLTSDGDYDVIEYGFYYDDSSTVTTTDDKIVAGTGDLNDDEKFDASLDSLDNDTRYYFRAYIAYRDNGGTRRTVLASNTRYFTTSNVEDEDRPEVITDTAASITTSSAKLRGEIDSIGSSDITEYGFYYGTSISTSSKKKVGTSIDEGDEFSYKLTGLKSDAKYYFKAYARNSSGIAYGSTKSFYTEEGNDKPSVSTKTPTTGGGYVMLNGVVTDKGDSSLEAYGFYYGTTSDPTTKIKVGSTIAEDKTFSYKLTGLSAGSYYVKAYATNDEGTGYGTINRFEVGSSASPSVFIIGSPYFNIRGAYQVGEAAPYIKNNRTYLPLKPVGYSVGIADSDIVWNAFTQTVTLTKGSTIAKLTIGSPIMYVNGSPVVMDVVPEITNSRTCLPIAHIVKVFGYTAYWNEYEQSVTIR